MEKNLYLIAGHNGAGKTTFLREFIKAKKLSYINADEIAQEISKMRFPLLAIKAGKRALKRIKKFRKEGRDFAVETTLSGKMWKKLISEFRSDNYSITIFFIYLTSPEEAVKRIAVRINKEGHYVSREDIYRRYFRSIKNFWFVYKNLADEWFLINNSGKFPYLVPSGRRKKYQVVDKESLEEFLSIVKRKERR